MAQTSGVSLPRLDSITGGWPQCVCGNSDLGFDGRFLNKSYPRNQKEKHIGILKRRNPSRLRLFLFNAAVSVATLQRLVVRQVA